MSNIGQKEFNIWLQVWNSLSREEQNVTQLLPHIPGLPMGIEFDLLFQQMGGESNRQTVESLLLKLHSAGILIYDRNWVWLLDKDIVIWIAKKSGFDPVEQYIRSAENVVTEYQENGMPHIVQGRTCVFKLKDNRWCKEELSFRVDVTQVRELSPFLYRKPVVGSKPLERPNAVSIDPIERWHYFPATIVRGVRRPPNHLYEDEDLLISVRDFGNDSSPYWQVRCFPKSSIPDTTWLEAERQLAAYATNSK